MNEYYDVQKCFAERLKYLREATKLSQDQLAKELGVSRGSISYYENCDRVPDIIFLKKTADFFGVSEDFLLGYVENESPKNVDIGMRLNLTDEAIDVFEWDDFIGTALSMFLTHEGFRDFAKLCEGYFHEENFRYLSSFGATQITAYPISSDEIESFRAFTISQIFIEILKSIKTKNYLNEKYGHFTEAEIIKLSEDLDRSIKEKMARVEQMTIDINKKLDDESERYKRTSEYQIRTAAREASLLAKGRIVHNKDGETNGET